MTNNPAGKGAGANNYETVGEFVAIFLRGDVWYVNYQHNGRQVRNSLKTKSKKEARRRALRIEKKLLDGEFQPGRRSATLEEGIAAFMKTRRAKGRAPRTLAKYENCFRLVRELAAELGVKRLSQIDATFMDTFHERRVAQFRKKPGRDGLKTALNDQVTIRSMVNHALKRKLVVGDPLAGFSMEKPKPKPQPYWSQEQLDRILAVATRQPHADVFRLLARTGMRIGEVKFLNWDDVDFENRVLKVQAKGEWKPKTGDARSIPMVPEVVEILQQQPRRAEWVFTFPADADGPVRQVSERRLLQYLQRQLGHLGLPGHLHTFRHTFISLALTRGTPEATVRKWVGHVDAEIMKRYTHIADLESHAAMQRLDESLVARRKQLAEEN